MGYSQARRHYRTVKKDINAQEATTQDYEKGVFIPKEKKPKMACIAALLILAVFLNGVIVGYLCANNDLS